jgi:hypothetical protein
LVGDANAAARLFDNLEKIVAIDAMLAENLARVACFLISNRQEQMLRRDVLVLHRIGLFLRGSENLAEAGREILLPTLHTRKTRDGGFAIILDDLNVRS